VFFPDSHAEKTREATQGSGSIDEPSFLNRKRRNKI